MAYWGQRYSIKSFKCNTVCVSAEEPKTYHHNNGYLWIQGSGIAQGRLFGGHTGLCGLKGELHDTLLEITVDDFKRKILFIEDIAEFFSSEQLTDFLLWLGNIGALQQLKGVIIGKLCAYQRL